MPKKIPIEMKRKWYEQCEGGKSEQAIAKDEKRDIRTIRDGIEEIRRSDEAKIARIEMIKEALHKHQNGLQDELRSISRSLDMPPTDFSPLSWEEGNNSVFSQKKTELTNENNRFAKRGKRSIQDAITIFDSLRQHLQNDKSKIWGLLAQWEKEYYKYQAYRGMLQKKVVTILGTSTGYHIVGSNSTISPPFVYSYVAGYRLYKSALDSVLSQGFIKLNEDEIVTDAQRGIVKYRNSILAEVPGTEDQTKQNLIKAYHEIRKSPEFDNVIDSTRSLSKIVEKVQPIIESILLLGFIPGRCNICQRLGL